MKKLSLTIIVSLLAGFIGGIIANNFLSNNIASAEKNSPIHSIVRATKFELVDQNGETFGSWERMAQGTFFQMKQKGSNCSFTIEQIDDMFLRLMLVNKTGNKVVLQIYEEPSMGGDSGMFLSDILTNRLNIFLNPAGQPKISLYKTGYQADQLSIGDLRKMGVEGMNNLEKSRGLLWETPDIK